MEQLFYLFSGFRWLDVLDILLNSYILFRLYVLFRGTNVIRVLLATCAFWAASQAAVPLGLIITNWAMQGVITVAALIIIIIFRNEISSVLQTNDLKSFLWGIPGFQFHTPLNIIVESVYTLAEKKIGALIVLPLKQGLDSVVQGGIPLKGKLSQEMLVSIFWPGNPMHDGAAVIQGDQITSTGVILPLSKKENLPSFFGTRHRAAVGLTELTDALVIVVSEERGKVSLFKENQTYNIQNRLALEKSLQKHAGDDSTKKGFRHQTIELITAALVSLFCVTGIWLSFSKGMETLATYEIPVEFMNPDQKMEIISSSASNVKLLISGARPLINSIKPEQINIKLNLSQSVVGINKLSITKENILLPPGIRLKKIEPSELDITLDTLVEKELPIQPHWIGELPKGLVMKEAKVTPQTIRITGGGRVLKDISTIFTEPISLGELTASGVVTVGLILNPVSLKLGNNNKIQIQYFISERGL
ncbi:MAG: diadenylate cyclase [Desulfobacula sp.]|uniref:diadenylate cyclase n=1 Tax=Desulfobacula sp. TaxID=2593537 RepID=UPI0025BA74E2|nr:diadenylate cyclase [Desulfobacula sp.]MCD4718921.1 diadenylate cyclase [Desulfobacula sp.]